jgi:hypothetical protein
LIVSSFNPNLDTSITTLQMLVPGSDHFTAIAFFFVLVNTLLTPSVRSLQFQFSKVVAVLMMMSPNRSQIVHVEIVHCILTQRI